KPLIPDHLKRIKESPRLQTVQKMLRSKYCKKILPWSQWCRDMIFSLINDPVILKKVELLYPAMHLPNQEKIRHQGARLIFVGGQRASFFRKGGADVLTIFSKLDSLYKNHIELIYIGNIPEEERRRYSKFSNIRFYEFIDKPRLFNFYRQSDIFVLPTVLDTFAFPILEAMSFGLPVVTTQGSCCPVAHEIIKDNEAGFLVPYEPANDTSLDARDRMRCQFLEKIRSLIENPKQRKEMGVASREEVANGKFSIRKRNKRLAEIYAQSF
ncbi:MAG: glycosyltransferase family 4 protein, partial [Pseudomonadota bacterium]